MKFTINLAFWELFKKRSPDSASNIQPQYVEEEQVFSVDLYDPQIGKLDQPVDLEKFMETMDEIIHHSIMKHSWAKDANS